MVASIVCVYTKLLQVCGVFALMLFVSLLSSPLLDVYVVSWLLSTKKNVPAYIHDVNNVAVLTDTNCNEILSSSQSSSLSYCSDSPFSWHTCTVCWLYICMYNFQYQWHCRCYVWWYNQYNDAVYAVYVMPLRRKHTKTNKCRSPNQHNYIVLLIQKNAALVGSVNETNYQ